MSGVGRTVLVLCCLKPRGARGEAERGELVVLQVPGFKKLQAFLHGQAFLQALGGRKRQTEVGWGGRQGAHGWGDVGSRGGGHPREISGACWRRQQPWGVVTVPGES